MSNQRPDLHPLLKSIAARAVSVSQTSTRDWVNPLEGFQCSPVPAIRHLGGDRYQLRHPSGFEQTLIGGSSRMSEALSDAWLNDLGDKAIKNRRHMDDNFTLEERSYLEMMAGKLK